MLRKTQYTIVLALMYMLGIFSFFKECEFLMSFVVFFVTIFLLFKNKITHIGAIAMTLCFLFGVFYTNNKMKTHDELSSIAPINATITGEVISIPITTYTDRTKFFVKVTSITINTENKKINGKTYVTISDSKENYSKIKIGDEIKLSAKLKKPQGATNPSQFSYKEYLKNFNTFTTAYVTKSNWEIIAPPQTLKSKTIQKINLLRHNIIKKHSIVIKSPNLEILGGIVFGDDAISAPEDIKDSFVHSGLMHILAASGLNVALIFGIWFFIFSKLKIHYKTGITTGIILILFYTLMTGLGPPVLRAALMLTFALIGKLIDRDADNIALLLLVATIILTYNPAYLLDVGFQLSFIVTLGLLTFCPIIAERTKNIPQAIAGAIYVPLIAQIMVAPIQMYYFNTFATYSLIANIVSLPFVSIISFLGFLSSMLAIIPKIPTIIISSIDILLNPILSILINISNFFSNLGNSLITIPQCTPFQIIIYYTLIVILFFSLKNGISKKSNIAFIFVLLTLIFSTISIKKDNLEAIIFNVGNADAILIKTPDNKYSIIDTARKPYQGGFSQAKAIIYEYLKDKNIKEIEYLIITHYDDDHVGGTTELMNLIKIKNIITSQDKNSEPAQKIIEKAKEKHINIIYPKNGQIIPFRFGKIKIFQKQHTSTNNSSIVTIFSYKNKNMLLPGDADLKTIESFELPTNIDILKVSHHGASGSTDIKFLNDKHIKAAILSTGPNQYGHPNFETCYNLQKSNVATYRTDAHNAIKIDMKNNIINVSTFNEQKKKWNKSNKI